MEPYACCIVAVNSKQLLSSLRDKMLLAESVASVCILGAWLGVVHMVLEGVVVSNIYSD